MTDIAALDALLSAISPLPYWIEPERIHPRYGPQDAYIACGTRGDSSDTYDLIERYNVDTDYAYLVAVANACPDLLVRIRALEQENTQLRDAAQRMIHASPSTYQDEMMALEEALAALDAATEAQ